MVKKRVRAFVFALAAFVLPMAVQAGSASLYVQDGLVACWDGIENAGANTHNPSATVWKDLVGGYEFTLTGVTVEDDRMTFAGSTSSYGTLSATDTTSTFVAAKNGTMEIVYVCCSTSLSVLLQSTAESGLAFGLYNASSIITHSASSEDRKPLISFTSGTTTNSVSVRFTSGGPVSAIANGESKSLSGSNYWGSPDASMTFIGKRASDAAAFSGSFYCIRLYNRQLSNDEIAANHALDVKRFREGNHFGDSLDISGAPNGIGSPSPAYGQRTGLSAGDTIPVSCGESPAITAAGKAYACTGWKLYDENGDVVSNGTETAFTYVHPTPAASRRLEWQWAESLTLLPIPDQVNESFDPCRPELTVSNRIDGTTWTIGGNLSSPYFDVEYSDHFGVGTAKATVIGKDDLSGLILEQTFNISATKREDDNVFSPDPSARRFLAGGKYVYVFTNAAAVQVSTVKRNLAMTDYLVVGGGGGGGNAMGGGGGGGGATNATGIVRALLSAGDTFTVSVGAGGAGASGYGEKGANGKETSFKFGDIFVSVAGGGGGGSWFNAAGADGASGGGGTQSSAGGAGTDGIGYAGATGVASSRAGGGGGGAGHAGYPYTDSPTKRAGNGGEGIVSSITGEATYYGGGGGGGADSCDPGLGGLGGGGDGKKKAVGQPGADGFGGGGGGGSWLGVNTDSRNCGGKGGSGTVILALRSGDFYIEPIPDQYLNAGVGGCTPEPVVRTGDGVTLLTKDVDYTVSYTDNTQPGHALLTVTGINGYAGNVSEIAFKIYLRYFVDNGAAPGGDGTSWASAMSVATAFETLANASGYNEIWMKQGTVSQPAFVVTNNGALVIRGGFAGTETTLDQRQPGALTTFDGEKTSSILLSINNTTDGDVVLDRIKFCRAKSNGFVKTGKGGLRAYDCVIEANGRDVGTVYGRGMNVQSDGYGSLVVSNCVFAGNRSINGDKQYGGFGIYVKSFQTVLIDNSLFVTNGYDLTYSPGSKYAGYLYARGSAILAEDSQITVRNSRFAGNNCPVRKKDDTNWCGGTIALRGACNGSVIEHCSLIGNTEYVSAGDEGPDCGGAIATRLNSASAKVAVRNCTIAYNITQSSASSGGITVYRGDVDISNTILWKNQRYHLTTKGYGKDVHVASTGSARIRHSLVTSLDAADETLGGANLVVDPDTVFAADPRLVTSTAAFEALLTTTASAVYYTYTNPTIYEDLASMDAHLLSPAGYCVNGGTAGPATAVTSTAIGAGDPTADYANEPSPNGSRLNLGAYGNSAEASRSVSGQPEATVAVVFPDGEARPVAQVTMGLEDGDGYLAIVHVACSVNGVMLVEKTFSKVANGDVLSLKSPSYLSPGDNFAVVVTIDAPGAERVVYNVSQPVSGTYPAFYGKGGGSNVIHVRTGADGLQDGTNWEHAYPDLRAAFASAPDASKTEVWLSVTNDYMDAAMTLAHSLVFRGGFTGAENSPEERPEGLRSTLDGDNCYYKTMQIDVPSEMQLMVERIRFSHSAGPGIKKSGAGDLIVRDCYFTDRKQSDWNLQGGGIYATGGTVSITNCQFVNLIDYSVNALSYSSYGGDGIYLSSCAAAYVDDCLFATNGIQFYRNKGAQARHTGSAAYINATPTVFRNCRFASNGAAIMDTTDSAGTIHFKGASGGSKLINCALVGNSDFEGSQSSADPTAGGTIACSMSTTDATLDIENCTIAYNLTQGKWTGAGINVSKGTVNLKNSIVYGNYRNRDSDTVSAGADIEVKSNATLNVSYTLVTGLESNYIHAVEGGTLNVGIGVITNAPLMVSTTNDFQGLFSTKDSNGLPYLPQSARAACAALDVHLRSPAGYMVDGQLFKYKNEMSPAIDAGDPTSDRSKEPTISGVGYPGPRVNLGAYGNTSEAAMTKFPGFYIYLR